MSIASGYLIFNTDRLHLAIGAMIAGPKAVLYANSYPKNVAMFHQWLGGRGCVWSGISESAD